MRRVLQHLITGIGVLVFFGFAAYFRSQRGDGEPEPWWLYLGAGVLCALGIWYDIASRRKSEK